MYMQNCSSYEHDCETPKDRALKMGLSESHRAAQSPEKSGRICGASFAILQPCNVIRTFEWRWKRCEECFGFSTPPATSKSTRHISSNAVPNKLRHTSSSLTLMIVFSGISRPGYLWKVLGFSFHILCFVAMHFC
uniref:Uncharacterized protein n=1 Tax=Ascaris lumbricoides TaxID=6252 RepID=A0A0M3HNT4_ASCLU